MFLTIDIGNTQTAIGFYDNDVLKHTWRIATHKDYTADELRLLFFDLMQTDNLCHITVDGAAIACVVPQLTSEWESAIYTMYGINTVVCNAQNAGDLFIADYPNISEIGSDRIADAIAAKARYGAPVIVVDFGTATNIEVINDQGVFIGGVLAPGVETSAQALFNRATLLSQVSLADPKKVIGRSTTSAIQSGILYGEADKVDGLIKRIFSELGYSAYVVATGGLANTVSNHSTMISEVNCNLTLEGLRLIIEAQKL